MMCIVYCVWRCGYLVDGVGVGVAAVFIVFTALRLFVVCVWMGDCGLCVGVCHMVVVVSDGCLCGVIGLIV